MAREPDPPDYATVRLTHHAAIRERAEALRRRSGRKSAKPECLMIGHAWTEEPNRDGGSICMICQVVRFP